MSRIGGFLATAAVCASVGAWPVGDLSAQAAGSGALVERIIRVRGPEREDVEGPTSSVGRGPTAAGAWSDVRVEELLSLGEFLRVARDIQVRLRYAERDGSVTLVTGHGMWDRVFDGTELVNRVPGAAVYRIDGTDRLEQGTGVYRGVKSPSWRQGWANFFTESRSDFILSIDSVGANGFLYVRRGQVTVSDRVAGGGELIRMVDGVLGAAARPNDPLRRFLDGRFDEIAGRPFYRTRVGQVVLGVGALVVAKFVFDALRGDDYEPPNVIVRLPR